MQDTPEIRYKDHHDPHNPACPHNQDAANACECKRVVNRKPYKVCKVEDRSVGHGIRPQFSIEIHPNGRLVIRELGRRLRVEDSLGAIYERGLMRDARREKANKKKARKEKRLARVKG